MNMPVTDSHSHYKPRHRRWRKTVHRLLTSTLISLLVLGTVLPLLAQASFRTVSQGTGATSSAGWPMKFCDTSGNCIVLVLVGSVYRVPVTCDNCASTAGGGGVVAQGAAGGTGWPVTESGAWGVTASQGGAWAVTASQGGAWTVTSTPTGTTTVAGTLTGVTGTFTANPAGTTTVVGTLTGVTGTFTPTGTTTITGTDQANQGVAANATAGWPTIAGIVTATTTALTSASPLDTTIGVGTKGYASALVSANISGSITLGTYIFEGSDDSGVTYKLSVPCARADVSPAGPVMTLAVNSPTQWLVCPMRGLSNFRARLNPAITNTGTGNITIQASNQAYDPFSFVSATLNAGGNTVGAVKTMVISATDTTASTAAGSDVRARADKFGDLITAFSIPDHVKSRSDVLTATTASSVLAAPGANYRYAIYGMYACNLSGVIATQLDITDSTGTIYSLPWTQTATTGGEDRCMAVPMNVPYFTAANSTISEKLTVANATGVRVILSIAQTGT